MCVYNIYIYIIVYIYILYISIYIYVCVWDVCVTPRYYIIGCESRFSSCCSVYYRSKACVRAIGDPCPPAFICPRIGCPVPSPG